MSKISRFFALSVGLVIGISPVLADSPAKDAVLLQGAHLFRGMNERQLPLSEAFSLLRGRKGAYIPSHRFSTLRSGGEGESSDDSIAAGLDADVAFWRDRGELGEIARCHADPYECWMPSVTSLRAVSMGEASGWSLPQALFALVSPGSDRFSVGDYSRKQRILRYFDPVISTSVSREVARQFARSETDASGRVFRGYVLEIRDLSGRNCSLERQRQSRCLVQTDEYGSEREYPFFGYIRGEEVFSVEVDGVRWVRKSQH